MVMANHYDDLRDQLRRKEAEIRWLQGQLDDRETRLRLATGEVRESLQREIGTYQQMIRVYQDTNQLLGPMVGEISSLRGQLSGMRGYLQGRSELDKALAPAQQEEGFMEKLDRFFGFRK